MKNSYPPVRLKVRLLAPCIAVNLKHDDDRILVNPTEDFEERSFIADYNGDYHTVFVVGDDDVPRFLYGPIGAFKIRFEAEPFLTIMETFRRQDKFVFFKNAVLVDPAEVNKFLALVEASELSEKDRHRARTWVRQMAKKAKN